MKSFGKTLKSLRVSRGLSQQQLADKLNTTKATISRYESEENEPKLDFLEKASKYFGCTIDYLAGKAEFEQGKVIYNIQEDLQKVMEKYDVDYIEVVADLKRENIDPETAKAMIKAAKQFWNVKPDKGEKE